MGYFLAFMAAVTWAVAPILYRRGVERISYSGLGALRCTGYIISAALFLFFAMGPSAFAPLAAGTMARIFVYSVLWLVMGDFFYFSALHKLGVSIAVPVTSSYPLLVVPASWIFLGEPASPMVFAAAVLIVAGLILLSPREDNPEGKRQVFGGLLVSFLAMSCWTFGMITNKVLMQTIPVPQLEWWRAVSVTTGSWIMFFLLERARGVANVSRVAMTEMAIAGALGLTVGNLFLTYSYSLAPVDVVVCIASIRPFLAALFATLFLRERLTPRLAGGIVLVFVGVMAISF
ncbi:MAG TPA: DMT family transporter [Methanothrix sp.]|nr:DMT family transporter [Methanothrix sp.]